MKLLSLTRRHSRLFFKDRGMFFSSLITPMILLLLFVTFLGNVYRDSFRMAVPEGMVVPEALMEGFVGGWLFSSLLAVCCVTVAFCSNLLIVQDKVTGARTDLTIAPVRRSTLALSYFLSTFLTTLLICGVAMAACLLYLWQVGWYLSLADILLTCLDVVLLTLFGTAFSSVVNHFLSTEGQMSAVGTAISACYGFLCGAYMPLSQFSEGIRRFISFLPGTYGTGLLHRHLMRGALAEMEKSHFPQEAVEALRTAFDGNIYFFDHAVSTAEMYLVLCGSVAALIALFLLMQRRKRA